MSRPRPPPSVLECELPGCGKVRIVRQKDVRWYDIHHPPPHRFECAELWRCKCADPADDGDPKIKSKWIGRGGRALIDGPEGHIPPNKNPYSGEKPLLPPAPGQPTTRPRGAGVDAELKDDARPSRPKLFGVNGPGVPARRSELEEAEKEEEDKKYEEDYLEDFLSSGILGVFEEEEDPPITLVISIADTGGNEILSEYEMTDCHADSKFGDFLDEAMDAARGKINFDHENYLSVLEHLNPEELASTFLDGNTGEFVKQEVSEKQRQELQNGRVHFALAKNVDPHVHFALAAEFWRKKDMHLFMWGRILADVSLEISRGHRGVLNLFKFQVAVTVRRSPDTDDREVSR